MMRRVVLMVSVVAGWFTAAARLLQRYKYTRCSSVDRV